MYAIRSYYVVDNPALCSFVFPAIVDRSPIVIGISSGGQSPVLARLLRAKLETLIPAGYSRLGALVGSFRERVKARFGSVNERRRFWEGVLQGEVAERVFAGRDAEAQQLLERQLEQEPDTTPVGEVYLVGAGPGDPELLTFKALRLIVITSYSIHYTKLYDPLRPDLVAPAAQTGAHRAYLRQRLRPHHHAHQHPVQLAAAGAGARYPGGAGRGADRNNFV